VLTASIARAALLTVGGAILAAGDLLRRTRGDV